jgi:hypothetical protein
MEHLYSLWARTSDFLPLNPHDPETHSVLLHQIPCLHTRLTHDATHLSTCSRTIHLLTNHVHLFILNYIYRHFVVHSIAHCRARRSRYETDTRPTLSSDHPTRWQRCGLQRARPPFGNGNLFLVDSDKIACASGPAHYFPLHSTPFVLDFFWERSNAGYNHKGFLVQRVRRVNYTLGRAVGVHAHQQASIADRLL